MSHEWFSDFQLKPPGEGEITPGEGWRGRRRGVEGEGRSAIQSGSR